MNFKRVGILVVLSLLSQQVHVEAALTCRGCDLTSNQTCDFTYKCNDNVEYCETLISKVNGIYSLAFGCGIEKCKSYGKNSSDAGLDKCDFKNPNTECWSCCGSDKCNIVNNAFAVLPKDAFKSKAKSLDLEELEDLEAKQVLKRLGDEIANDEEEFEKNKKFRKISKGGNFSTGSNEMTSTVKTTSVEVTTMELSKTSSVLLSTSEPKTSFTKATETTLNSTSYVKLTTAGVESSNEFTMPPDNDKNNYTRASNDSHIRSTTHESIHKATHQSLKSSASLSSITIPLFLATIFTFLFNNSI